MRRPARSAALGLFLAVAFAGCHLAPPPHSPSAEIWLTSADGARRFVHEPALAWRSGEAGPADVTIRPQTHYQTMLGFGAAMTDASALLIDRALTPRAREALLHELFDPRTGLGLSAVRLPIGASDFSEAHYSLDDSPGDAPDPALAHFSLDPRRVGAPALMREARRINPDLKLFAAPWSAPAWMKESGSLIKGRLDPRYFGAFALYLDAYVGTMAEAGAPIFALTLQNEPDFEPSNYPGMKLAEADRAALIGTHLGPVFAAHRRKTLILDWDHNWDRPQSPEAVLADARAAPYVAGVAWHCYAGEVAAQSRVHDAFPEKDAYLTECSGGGWMNEWPEAFAWQAKNLLIGATRHWARSVILWNLALDPGHGPHLGGCGNCRGVVSVDPADGAITRNAEYYLLAHASRFVRPGAVRLETTLGASDSGLAAVAFRNPKKRDAAVAEYALLLYNEGPSRVLTIAFAGQVLTPILPADTLVTIAWNDPASHRERPFTSAKTSKRGKEDE